MTITVKKLSTGYYHIRGEGPCNWAQTPYWPCSADELRRCAFPEASEAFIRLACEEKGEEENARLKEERNNTNRVALERLSRIGELEQRAEEAETLLEECGRILGDLASITPNSSIVGEVMTLQRKLRARKEGKG